jgi:hypothetical protein
LKRKECTNAQKLQEKTRIVYQDKINDDTKWLRNHRGFSTKNKGKRKTQLQG